jgi:hypothetical protein
LSTTTNKPVKFIGLFVMIAGLLMIIAGGATWVTVQSQLKAEKITVAKVTDQNPGRLAGKPVAGPFTAYAQANAIKEHALEGADGRTYAEIGQDATELKARLEKAGANKDQVAENEDVKALAATRTSTMNGSFLRASLFTSVVSFGVAALVMGLGLLFILLGFALQKLSTTTVATTDPATP